jgi:hypothetical protein
MVGAGALTPALANYSQCDEQPNAESCPTYSAPALNQNAATRHANNRHAWAYMSSQKLGSPFKAAHVMTAYSIIESVLLHPSLPGEGWRLRDE